MSIRLSIITPTILRPSLARCIDSVNAQSYGEWQHIIMVDKGWHWVNSSDSRRTIYRCEEDHHNSGNTCRHNAWDHATGDYIWHLDDDNYIADPDILTMIADYLAQAHYPIVAMFPIMRFGQIFFSPPPRSCHCDTMNLIVKRPYARWPDRPEYTADGFWAEDLVREHGFTAFHSRPIGVMDTQGKGE